MLLSLLVLGGAIATIRLTQRINDEIVKIVGVLLGLGCIVISLILAPWILKLIIVLALVSLPRCIYSNTRYPIPCPQLCVAKDRCQTSETKCGGWVRSPLPHHLK